jgi:hypothetical protein
MWANSPIGRRFKVLFSPWITVVGVAADTRNDSLRDRSSPSSTSPILRSPSSTST